MNVIVCAACGRQNHSSSSHCACGKALDGSDRENAGNSGRLKAIASSTSFTSNLLFGIVMAALIIAIVIAIAHYGMLDR